MQKYTSTLRTQPSWLETFPNEFVTYGFDEQGMWFIGDANDDPTYPVRTNFDFQTNDILDLTFTFIHSSDCSDQGVCIFPANIDPYWSWNDDETRIAFQYNCQSPELDGQISGGGEGNYNLTVGHTYTGRLIYNPIAGTVTGETYVGNKVNGNPVDSITIFETLPPGPYRIGFDADKDLTDLDGDQGRSYFTKITINEPIVATTCTPKICVERVGMKCFARLSCSCKTSKIIKDALVPAITVCNMDL